MLDFLQNQISRLQPLRHKVVHQSTLNNDIHNHHNHLSHVLNEEKCKNILDDLDLQQTKDDLLFQKIQSNQILREKQEELQMVLLQKNRMMKQCQLNECKLQKHKDLFKKLQQESNTLVVQKSKISRQIKQNQIICQKICMENDKLRQNCEEIIQQVSSCTVEGQRSRINNCIRTTIDQNIKIISQIINLSQPLRQKQSQINRSNLNEDKLKIIRLTQQLQLQNSQNFLLKNQIKCQESRYFELSSKLQFVQKDLSLRQCLIQSASQEQYQLSQEVQIQKTKNHQLQSKLTQFKRTKKQLQQLYDNLSLNYKNSKASDLSCIKQMNKNSYKFQRNITKQKHFLLQRYSIVDSYRKYLTKNN